jgi:hypothetical protein
VKRRNYSRFAGFVCIRQIFFSAFRKELDAMREMRQMGRARARLADFRGESAYPLVSLQLKCLVWQLSRWGYLSDANQHDQWMVTKNLNLVCQLTSVQLGKIRSARLNSPGKCLGELPVSSNQ